MYFRLCTLELWTEKIVTNGQKLLDYDFSTDETHIWVWRCHILINRAIPATDRVTHIMNRRANMRKPFGSLSVPALRYQWSVLKSAMKLEDDPQFIVHTLRHTCASRLVQKGVPLAVVQKWMGHLNIQTTLRYAHLAPDDLKGALDKLQGSQSVAPVLRVVNN